MIISERSADAMNGQIGSEFLASAQYVAIAVYFDQEALPDLAQFFYRQAEEERMHAMKFVHFLLETGARPLIPGLPDVRNDFGSAAEAVQYALDQEKKVTAQINSLMQIAVEERDFTSHNFVQWFVEEQVEEVDTMTTLLATIKHAAGNLLLVEDYVRRHAPHQGAPAEAAAG
jgi:ferritin